MMLGCAPLGVWGFLGQFTLERVGIWNCRPLANLISSSLRFLPSPDTEASWGGRHCQALSKWFLTGISLATSLGVILLQSSTTSKSRARRGLTQSSLFKCVDWDSCFRQAEFATLPWFLEIRPYRSMALAGPCQALQAPTRTNGFSNM